MKPKNSVEMKKLFFYPALAIGALNAFTSCSNDDEPTKAAIVATCNDGSKIKRNRGWIVEDLTVSLVRSCCLPVTRNSNGDETGIDARRFLCWNHNSTGELSANTTVVCWQYNMYWPVKWLFGVGKTLTHWAGTIIKKASQVLVHLPRH